MSMTISSAMAGAESEILVEKRYQNAPVSYVEPARKVQFLLKCMDFKEMHGFLQRVAKRVPLVCPGIRTAPQRERFDAHDLCRGSRADRRNRKKSPVFEPRPRESPQRVARGPQKS